MTDLLKRQFLKMASTSAGAAILAACSSQEPMSNASAVTAASTGGGASAGMGPELNRPSVLAASPAPSVGPQLPVGFAQMSSSAATTSAASASGGSPPSMGSAAPPPAAGSTASGPTSTQAAASSGASSSNPMLANLQAFFAARTSLAMPSPPASLPQISWAGPFGDGNVPTSISNGAIFPITNGLISWPIRQDLNSNLPGNPTVSGTYPCFEVAHAYTAGGVAQSVGSPVILRFRTDAPVIELSGVVADGGQTVQTLMVDGQLAPPTILSSSRGRGGWNSGTIRIALGGRQMRDIWLETAMAPAYLKIDQYSSLVPPEDASDPQMTVIGDSYQLVRSAAFGNGGAIALEIAARLGIRKVSVDGIGGTGYYTTNFGLGNLGNRLSADGADGSSLYLVMAGLNDAAIDLPNGTVSFPTESDYVNTVNSYMAGLRAANPNAVIVVTAPFCPNPTLSDATYGSNTSTNPTALGIFQFKAMVQRNAITQISGPWVYIDVLMGTGWLNSSGASGNATNLQWFTGGTPAPGTTATNRQGNTAGGGGGGFGGIASVPIVTPGHYSQAPELTASGGSGSGLLLAAILDSSGGLSNILAVVPGSGYTTGSGLPQISIDPTFQISPAVLGAPTIIAGVNPSGEYPLPSFAPPNTQVASLNNIYTYLLNDLTHPSPPGASYLAQRLARDIYSAVRAL